MNDNNTQNATNTTSNVMLVVTLPMSMYSTLKKICDETGTDLGDFLRSSIQKYIGDQKEENQQRK